MKNKISVLLRQKLLRGVKEKRGRLEKGEVEVKGDGAIVLELFGILSPTYLPEPCLPVALFIVLIIHPLIHIY